MKYNVRTDLALESHELWKKSVDDTTKLSGVEAKEWSQDGFKVTAVNILDGEGVKELGKPEGSYVTLELDSLLRREENSFVNAVEILADQLKKLLNLEESDSIFVTGLGNADITPDAIGPLTVGYLMITRHLKERMPEDFSAFRQVSAIQTGVLGTTGMESAKMISAVCDEVKPNRVIAVDALASYRPDRLCRIIQLSDSGIIPGSGVGNSRSAINIDLLGVPVIAVGVPTVMDATAMVSELSRIDRQASDEELVDNRSMIVTPRDIDKSVRDMAKLIGYGINLALHDDLTLEDIDMFIS